MHRFLATRADLKGGLVALSTEESKHAAQVLRLTVGDVVELLDGCGGKAAGVIETISKKEVAVRISRREQQPAVTPGIVLCPALLKGKAMDWLVQKACELGASTIQPIAAERCVAKVAPHEGESKVAGWNQTALEALKQCGNTWLPEIHPPAGLAEAAARFSAPGDLCLVASLQEANRSLRQRLRDWSQNHPSPPSRIVIWIGPEGDFTPAELAKLQNQGVLPFTLGRNVLRAETASIAALAIARALSADQSS